MKNAIICSIALALTVSSAAWAQKGDSDKQEVMPAPKPVEKDTSKAPQTPAPKPPASTPSDSANKGTNKDKAKNEAPPAEAITCTLLTKEAPRGGRLEVEGAKLGKSPVVKIGGTVTRIIERPGDKIAVQIPRKSDGGPVVVLVDGKDIACGTLTIIGLD